MSMAGVYCIALPIVSIIMFNILNYYNMVRIENMITTMIQSVIAGTLALRGEQRWLQ